MTANVVLPRSDGQGGMTMRRSRTVDALNLDEVRTRFENWRQNRRGKQPIPDQVWLAGVEVGPRGGGNPTAAAQHLEGGKGKRRVGGADSESGEGMAARVGVVLLRPP